jgi:hypothetical protein
VELRGGKRAAQRQTNASQPVVKKARRRSAMAVFSALAAVGFVGATVAPVALASTGPVAAPAPISTSSTAYQLSASGAQAFTAADAVVSGEVARDSYMSYQTPTPTPTPTPEPASVDEGSSGGSGGNKKSGGGEAPKYTGGGSPSEWMAAAGIAESDWGYVDYIVSKESGWNPSATNSSSGACGLVQALPCSKVPGGGYDPVANLTWGNGYAVGRYGSWAEAYNFWVNNHWW